MTSFLVANPFLRRQAFLLFVDSLLIFLAVLFSYFTKFYFTSYDNLELIREKIFLIFFVIGVHLIIFYIFDLYNVRSRFEGAKNTFLVFVAVLISATVLSIIFYLIPNYKVGRVVLTIHVFLTFSFIYFWRIIFVKAFMETGVKEKILFIGNDLSAEILMEEIKKNANEEFEVVGVIELAPDEAFSGRLKRENPGLNIFGGETPLSDLIRQNDIQIIILTAMSPLPPRLMKEALELKFSGLQVWDMPNFYTNLTGKIPVYNVKESWFLHTPGILAFSSPMSKNLKRILDVIFSFIGLVLGLPFFIILPLLIRLDSSGPALLKQRRTGKNLQEFTLYKFRTMIDNAEAKTGPVWAQKQDPRVTRLGRVLRKTRLDEIPQLLSVFTGRMSFIGPRPIRLVFERDALDQIPFYSLRHSIKPGITGWAQVNQDDPRGGKSPELGPMDRLQYDLYYIQNGSFLLDFLILIKTVQTVLFGKGV